MADSLANVARWFSQALAPLSAALAGPDAAFTDYVRRLGWVLPAVPPALADLRATGDDFVRSLSKFEGLLRQDGDVAAAQAAVAATELVAAVGRLADAIRALPAGLRAQLPQAFIDASRIAEQWIERLFDDALVRQIEDRSPALMQALQFAGLVERVAQAADPARFQPAYDSRAMRWDRLAMLDSGPAALARDVYGWGAPDLDGRKLFLALRDLAFATSTPAFFDHTSRALLAASVPGLPGNVPPEPGLLLPLFVDTPLELVLACYTLPKRSAGELQGLVFTLAGLASIQQSTALTPDLTLEVDSRVDLASGVALALWPDRSPQLLGNATAGVPASITDANCTLRLRYAPQDTNERLSLLSFDGLQLDARGAVVEASFGAAAGQAAFGAKAVLPGLRLQLGGLGQDSFLSQVLPEGAQFEMDFGAGWSLAGGLTWQGGAGPKVRVPVARTIGPVKLDALEIEFVSGTGAVGIGLGLSASARIGPVGVQVQGVGFSVGLDRQGGRFGLFDLTGALKPPSGIGLSIEAQGVLNGGGFLAHDAALGQYAGVMQLSLQDRLTLKAFGLVATRLPDGSRGYSLLVFITAEDFRPVPLGLGFTLQAIGGMLAVNRTFDQDVLRAGLKNDTLGSLLFPRDPVGNAPALIAALAAAFPARAGSYLLGLLVRIGWMTPVLVQLDLALVLEFGARRRLLALGRASSILPSREQDLLRLNLDALGVLDFDAGTLSVDAVLVDSRLAQRFAITGAAALRAGWGAGSEFVLSAGGFNPHFTPPATLPRLERLAIALGAGDNPRLSCEAYWAITANTYQFGARAQLHAQALGFTVEGDVGFDVLVVAVPLHFIADYHASVQLKRGSDNLFKVTLDGELEGPRPLRLSGTAGFEIFWCSFSVRYDATLIDGDPPPPPPAVDVLAELQRALATAQSWSTELAAGNTHGVALRRLAPGPALVLDPLGRISVKQQLVPLDTARDIDRFGGAPLAGARRFRLSAAINGQVQPASAIQDRFAPAQYFEMSDDDKLAAPAFESMDAGLVFGSEDVQFDRSAGAFVAAPLQYEQIVVDGAAPAAPAAAAPKRVALPASQLQPHTGAAARSPLLALGSQRYANAAAAPVARTQALRWTIVPLTEGAAAAVDPALQTWSEYRARLGQLNRGGAAWQMVPRHELTT